MPADLSHRRLPVRLWRVLAIVGVIGVSGWWWVPAAVRFVGDFFKADLANKDSFSSVISMVVGILSLLTSISLGYAQIRSARLLGLSGDTRSTDSRQHGGPSQHETSLEKITRLERVDNADALALRVHPAIDLGASASATDSVSHLGPGGRGGSLNPDLPLFVPREKYAQVCKDLFDFRRDGGFLLLVGNSSVGKTRLLFEATRAVLGDFRLFAPSLGDGDSINSLAKLSGELPPLVVWLDELQRFLDGPYLTAGHTSITASAVRKLLESSSPVVFVGTLWPEYARQFRSTDRDDAAGLWRPRYPSALDILRNSRLREISLAAFSAEEREKAAEFGDIDPRLAVALKIKDHSLTAVLGGAREIVRRYEQGAEGERAIIDAAVDARRLGIQTPLKEEVLLSAARAYLHSHHPSDDWFSECLNELIVDGRPQDRATAPIVALISPDRRSVVGYAVTDYLLQRLVKERENHDIPDIAWETFVGEMTTLRDRMRLAASAVRAGVPRHAESLYRRVLNSGDEGSQEAGRELSELLVSQGRLDELGSLADEGNSFAIEALVGLFMWSERADEAFDKMRTHADNKGVDYLRRFAAFLEVSGRDGDAMLIFRGLAAKGDRYGQRRLLEMLLSGGKIDEAIEISRAIENRSWFSAFGLSEIEAALN
ncbi:hypothetical protein ACSNN9_15310 [Micromonospora sp. URMC 107]|uniref:hypothetical protein n=1 Tax=Micromonospora sp. URMC 107 TaxID=3423418 RepID=UPI003F1A9D96